MSLRNQAHERKKVQLVTEALRSLRHISRPRKSHCIGNVWYVDTLINNVRIRWYLNKKCPYHVLVLRIHSRHCSLRYFGSFSFQNFAYFPEPNIGHRYYQDSFQTTWCPIKRFINSSRNIVFRIIHHCSLLTSGSGTPTMTSLSLPPLVIGKVPC